MKELQAGIRVVEDVVGWMIKDAGVKERKETRGEKNEIKNIRKEEGKVKKKNKEQRKGRMNECYGKKRYITQ